MAADPSCGSLGPFDARLETCAVASAITVYSRPSESIRLKRRGVHGMYRTYSSRKTSFKCIRVKPVQFKL